MKNLSLIILFLNCLSVNAQTLTYNYDTHNRLTKITSANRATITYTYDEVGNRTGSIRTATQEISNLVEADVFPNPTSGIFTIKGSVKEQSAITFSLYTADGRLVLERREPSVKIFQQDFDMSTLSTGLYELVVSTMSERQVFKIVRY